MAKDKEIIEDEPAGAPEWMVTFSDCMTLLLTFFVLLLSYSSFTDEKLQDVANSFGRFSDTINLSSVIEREDTRKAESTFKIEEVKTGSKTPSPEKDDSNNVTSKSQKVEFRNIKIFTMPSEEMFLANGFVISPKGKEILEHLAKFVNTRPSRVVISEHGADMKSDDIKLGIKRSSQIAQYLVKESVDQNLLNISSSTMGSDQTADRIVEITLLEKDIY